MAIAETKGVNLDELQQETEKLLALLKDRQPGMISWHIALNERLKYLGAFIQTAGLSAEASAKAENTYPLTVDYGRSVEDAVKLGYYDLTNRDINSRNFPTERKGTADVGLELVHFNRITSTGQALSELDKMGMRPAELHELLALGEKYPDVQREFPVVALGSVWQDRYGYRCVPYLSWRGSERHLDLRGIGPGWLGICRFAAVRSSTERRT